MTKLDLNLKLKSTKHKRNKKNESKSDLLLHRLFINRCISSNSKMLTNLDSGMEIWSIY